MAKKLIQSLNVALKQAQESQRPVWLHVYTSWGQESLEWKKQLEKNESWPRLLEEMHPLEWNRDWSPEVDQALQSFMQSRSGHSGWPMNVFLSPQGEALFMCGALEIESFVDLTRQLLVAWKLQPEDLREVAAQELEAFRKSDPLSCDSSSAASPEMSENSMVLGQAGILRFLTPLEKSLNVEKGYLGQGQIFHYPYAYRSLLSYEDLSKWGELSLLNLAKSPLCDVIGGGFFRSVEIDDEARLKSVSCEKLLIENAELLDVYLDACSLKKTPFFEQVAHEILESLLRDFQMKSTEGGEAPSFASAVSQSPDYYHLVSADLLKALSSKERQAAQLFFGIDSEAKVPSIETDVSILSEFVDVEPVDLRLQLIGSRKTLLKYREERSGKLRKSPPDRLSELTLLRVLARVVFMFDTPEIPQICDSLFARYQDEFRSDKNGATWTLREKAAYMRVLSSMTRLKTAHRDHEAAKLHFEEFEEVIFSLKDPLLSEAVWSLPVLGERVDLCDHGGVSGMSSLLIALLDYNSLTRMGLRAKYNLPVDVGHTLAWSLEKARPLGLYASSLYWALMRFQKNQMPVGNA